MHHRILQGPSLAYPVYICSCANAHPSSGPSEPSTAPIPYVFVPLPSDFDKRLCSVWVSGISVQCKRSFSRTARYYNKCSLTYPGLSVMEAPAFPAQRPAVQAVLWQAKGPNYSLTGTTWQDSTIFTLMIL